MNKPTLIDLLQQGFEEVENFATQASYHAFYAKPADEVWSAAENVQHLIQSVFPLNRLLGRPKSYFEEKWGLATHTSRTYQAIITAYHTALGDGIRATGAFAPLDTATGLPILLGEFAQTNAALLNHLTDWSEEDLDNYVIPHPLLGLLTIREMLLFTAYHTRHHLEIMRTRVDLASC
ncbi:MAG: DinB family protein [Spirosomataceae bacterium]